MSSTPSNLRVTKCGLSSPGGSVSYFVALRFVSNTSTVTVGPLLSKISLSTSPSWKFSGHIKTSDNLSPALTIEHLGSACPLRPSACSPAACKVCSYYSLCRCPDESTAYCRRGNPYRRFRSAGTGRLVPCTAPCLPGYARCGRLRGLAG